MENRNIWLRFAEVQVFEDYEVLFLPHPSRSRSLKISGIVGQHTKRADNSSQTMEQRPRVTSHLSLFHAKHYFDQYCGL